METEQERKMKWTDQEINKLKEMWEQGIIATEIAEILGTTKGSVIGKANRLDCIPRKVGNVRGVKRPHTFFKENPKITPVIEPEDPTSLIKITDNQCKFPLWKNSSEPQLFCGRTHWNKSYCKMHYDKTHDKPQAKERRV